MTHKSRVQTSEMYCNSAGHLLIQFKSPKQFWFYVYIFVSFEDKFKF